MSGLYRSFGLLAVALIVGVADARAPQRIVGGTEAAPGEFPYQVSLRVHGNLACGGVIISERHILTAAHCVAGIATSGLRVITGSIFSTGGRSYAAKSVLYHAQYETRNADSANDIAIIVLATDLKFDKDHNKINLPMAEPPSGVLATATGWGSLSGSRPTNPNKLRKVQLRTLKAVECQKYLPSSTIYTHQICTRSPPGRGVCNGDSGGPLAYNGQLIGIVSYGIPCGLGHPDVFTSVYHYRDWIQKIIATT